MTWEKYCLIHLINITSSFKMKVKNHVSNYKSFKLGNKKEKKRLFIYEWKEQKRHLFCNFIS